MQMTTVVIGRWRLRQAYKSSLVFSLDKAFRRAVLGVDEDDVFRVASRCVEREKGDRPLKNFGQSMNGAALEEEEVDKQELPFVRVIAHPEGTSPRENIEVLVAACMIMGR